MESNDLSTSTMMMKPIETIINSNVVKLVRFNSSTIVSNHRTMTKNIFCFEITFKHTSIVDESDEQYQIEHECVHWDVLKKYVVFK